MTSPAGHDVRGDVEDAGELRDLRRHGDRDEEDRDREDLMEDLAHGVGDHGSGTGPNSWLQVQPAQVTSSLRRSSSAACTSA